MDAPDAHLLAWRDWSEPDPDQVIEGQGCFADHGVLEAVDAMLSPLVDCRAARPPISNPRARWWPST
jgi:ribonuclease G